MFGAIFKWIHEVPRGVYITEIMLRLEYVIENTIRMFENVMYAAKQEQERRPSECECFVIACRYGFVCFLNSVNSVEVVPDMSLLKYA